MKNLNLYILLIALLGFVACEDDYEAPYPVTDVTWYTSMPNVTEYFLLQEEMMGFIDASQGALSHEWIIEDGSYFLRKGANQGDSLHLFIDHSKGLKNDEAGINVYFPEAGRKSVRLRNTFSEKVTYDGARALEAKQEGDVWVIDTTFFVDVYAPIKPAYKVCRVVENPDKSLSAGEVLLTVGPDDEPNPEESDTWTLVEVETGERLMFIDLTKDENPDFIQPNTRTWTIRNSPTPTTYNDSVTIAFFNVFKHQAAGLGSLLSERNAVGAPAARAQKIIPLKINVIQSTKPFTYADGAIWTSSNSIAFNVAGEIASLGDNPESGFTVHLTNASKGIDKDVAVTKVSFEPTNRTRLTLTLDEPIYGDDIVTIKFDETGTNLVSSDERPFKSFAETTVASPELEGNALIDDGNFSGFEASGAGLNMAFVPQYWVGGQDAANPEWQRTTEKYYSGEASMKYNGGNSGKSLGWMQLNKSADISAGTYEVSHKIFIETGSTIQAIRTTIAPKSGGWPIEASLLWDLSGVTRGEWVTIKTIAKLPNDINVDSDQYRYSYMVSASDNPGVTGTQTFYLDDLSFIRLTAGVRP